MTDPSTDPTRVAGPAPRMPRWVKVLGLLLLLLVVAVAVLHATGNSVGGPGDHLRLGSTPGHREPTAGAW